MHVHFIYQGNSKVFCKNKHVCQAGDRTGLLISIYLALSLFGFILEKIGTLLYYKQVAEFLFF